MIKHSFCQTKATSCELALWRKEDSIASGGGNVD